MSSKRVSLLEVGRAIEDVQEEIDEVESPKNRKRLNDAMDVLKERFEGFQTRLTSIQNDLDDLLI